MLVDDDDVDVQGFKRAFAKHRIGNPITVAQDGIEALDNLRGLNGKAKVPRPRLVLLDINMPRMNGFEFLRRSARTMTSKPTIVFIVTTSKADEDKARAYGHNVAGYIVKQDPVKTFLDAVTLLEHYWKIVEFPE